MPADDKKLRVYEADILQVLTNPKSNSNFGLRFASLKRTETLVRVSASGICLTGTMPGQRKRVETLLRASVPSFLILITWQRTWGKQY